MVRGLDVQQCPERMADGWLPQRTCEVSSWNPALPSLQPPRWQFQVCLFPALSLELLKSITAPRNLATNLSFTEATGKVSSLCAQNLQQPAAKSSPVVSSEGCLGWWVGFLMLLLNKPLPDTSAENLL